MEAHFVSWMGLTPNREITGGKVIRQPPRRVNNWAGRALRMAASTPVKAMARHLACLVYRMLTHGQAWVDRGTQAFERACPAERAGSQKN